jgi:hypothetical protein
MAFAGMLNGTGTDRSAAFALDQAVVPGLVSDTRRTQSLAWYNVLLDGGASLGALAAGLPLLLQARFSQSMLGSYRAVFFAYAGLCLPVAVLYLFLSPAVESGVHPHPDRLERGSNSAARKSSQGSRLCLRSTLSGEAF